MHNQPLAPVAEAVPEDPDLKRETLRAAEGAGGPGTVIASNTSTIPIGSLAKACARPERVVGLHFFNPVDRMPLVEVVPSEATAPEAVRAAVALARRLGKTPVVVRDRPGFLVNRVLAPYLQEACQLALEGAPIDAVDGAMLRFGMPMGPFRLLDEVGIGVARAAAATLAAAFPARMGEGACAGAGVIARMDGAERFWRRRGGPFGGGRWRPNEPYLTRLLQEVRAARGVSPRGGIGGEEIVERLILIQVNEACHALAESVVEWPGAADLAMVYGTGFAPFRGGLLRHADSLGSRRCFDALRALAGTHGPRFDPAPFLRDLAARDGTFY